MPLFLFEGKCLRYALLRLAHDKAGATRHAATIFKLIESSGGKCKNVYFGPTADVFAIASVPDTRTAGIVKDALNESACIDVTIRHLMSPAKFDALKPEFIPFESAFEKTLLDMPTDKVVSESRPESTDSHALPFIIPTLASKRTMSP